MADPTAGTGWVERSLEHLVTPESKKTLEKNKYGGGCHTDTAIRIAWYWHIDQWIRTRSPEINPQIHSQTILTRVPRSFNGEKRDFSTNGAGGT